MKYKSVENICDSDSSIMSASIEYRKRLRSYSSGSITLNHLSFVARKRRSTGSHRKKSTEYIQTGVTNIGVVDNTWQLEDITCPILKLSLEVLCKVLRYLSLKEMLKLECVCKRLQDAVCLQLRICQSINFIEGKFFSCMSEKINDDVFSLLLPRCPDLRRIYGLFPKTLMKRRARGQVGLSIPGVITSLNACKILSGVELDNVFLLEAVLRQLPKLVILNCFRNREDNFPPPFVNRMQLTNNPKITRLHLFGIPLFDLPVLDNVQELYLNYVRLTGFQPFRNFRAQNLKTFVMANCAGPIHPLKYVPLAMSLGASRNLTRLELVRVPFFGNLFQHVVDDTWKIGGFRNLRKLLISGCKNMTETDLGYLVLTASNRLKEILIQPSLTRDSFIFSLAMAEGSFPSIEALELGYQHSFPDKEKYSNQQLVSFGLADVTEHPGLITDIGMRSAGKVFHLLKTLIIHNCPHLHLPSAWQTQENTNWQHLKHLELYRCHSISLDSLCFTIPSLPQLQFLGLSEMFKEPPKGCSRVGLSAGTGLGVASALMTNHDPGGAAAVADVQPANLNDRNDQANIGVPPPPVGPAGVDNQIDNVEPVDIDVVEEIVVEQPAKMETTAVNKYANKEGTDKRGVGEINSANAECNTSIPSEQNVLIDKSANDADVSDVSEKTNLLDTTTLEDRSGINDERIVKNQTLQTKQDNNKGEIQEPPCKKTKMQSVDNVKQNSPDRSKMSFKGKGKRLMGKKGGVMKRSKTSKTVPSNQSLENLSSNTPSCDEAECRTSSPTDEPQPGCSKELLSEIDNSEICENISDPLRMYTQRNEDYNSDEQQSESSSNIQGVGRQQSDEITKNYNEGKSLSLDCAVNNSNPFCTSCHHEDGPQHCRMSIPHTCDYPSQCLQLDDMNVSPKNELNIKKGHMKHTVKEVIPAIAESSDDHLHDYEMNFPSCNGEIDDLMDRSEVRYVLKGGRTNNSCGNFNQMQVNDTNMERNFDSIHLQTDDIPSTSSFDKKSQDLRDLSDYSDDDLGDKDTSAVKNDSSINELVSASDNVQQDSGEVNASIDVSVFFKAGHGEHQNNGESRPSVNANRSLKMNLDDNARVNRASSPQPGCSHQVIPTTPDGSTRITRSKKRSLDKAFKKEESNVDKSAVVDEKPRVTRQRQKLLSTGKEDGSHAQGTSRKRRRSQTSQCKPTAAERLTRRGPHPADPTDPRMEEDTVQVLTLESNTLDCVYIYKCGITDIVVECPNLTHLDATCCRSLKNVDLPNAPKLQSVYLCSCKKLNHTGVVEEIIKLPPVTSRKVILRPMQNYNHEDVEEVLFSENQKYGAILMRDHAKQPDINFSQRAWLRTAFYAMADAQRWLYYEMRKKDWLDHESGFKDMNRYSFPVQQSSQRKYPWGRDVAYYYGCCSDDPGSDWDIITDVAWFRGEPVQSELHSKDKKKFILKWSVDDLKQNLDGVADYVQGGVLPVFPALVSVVVLLCDLNRPTVCHDMYM